MSITRSLCAAGLVVLGLAWNAAAGEVFVDRHHPRASDTNPGTQALPWMTIQHAADVVAPGDVVVVKAGTYPEAVLVTIGGTEDSWVSFTTHEDDAVIVDGSSVVLNDEEGLITLHQVGYVRLDGFRVEHSGPHGNNPGILAYDTQHVVIRDNRTEDTASSGIMIWSSTDVLVTGNEIVQACSLDEASTNECLTVGESSRVEILDNHVHHGSQIRGEGIDVKDGSSDVVVRANHVHDVMGVGIYVDAWDKSTHDIEIDGNLVHDIEGDAFATGSEQGGLLERVRFVNNIGADSRWVGINLHDCCISSHPVDSVEVINNTFVGNGTGDWGGGILVENDQTTNVVIRNNIVSDNLSFQIALEVASPSGVTVDHNLIDGFRGSSGEVRGEDFREGEPLFVDSQTGDYRLTSGSPAVDNGSSRAAPATDHEGIRRPQGSGFDIGAFEMASELPPNPSLRWSVAGVAHNAGVGGTSWRTDLTVLNRGTVDGDLQVSFYPMAGAALAETATIPAGGLRQWRNVVESLFGLSAGAEASGSVLIESDQLMVVVSRTFNQTAEGTYGQFLPGVGTDDTVGPGVIGWLAQIRGDSDFRTNLGVVNTGEETTTTRIQLHDADGAAVGSPLSLDVAPRSWRQINKVVQKAGLSVLDSGFATVEVVGAAGTIWAYASVVDNRTGDATTIPVAFGP